MNAAKPSILIAENRTALVTDTILPQLDMEGYPHGPDGRIDVEHAPSIDEALRLIRERYFHLAFVDLRLDPNDKELTGLTLLRELAEHSPSCERVLMTSFGQANFAEVFRLVAPNPATPSQLRLINKADSTSSYYASCVTISCHHYLEPAWGFDGLDELIDIAAEPARREALGLRPADEAVATEVATLMDLLFRDLRGVRALGEHARIRFRPMAPGGSWAFVCTAEPHFGVDAAGNEVVGNKLVVKIGPREKMADEAERFRGLVQLGVPSDFRTELVSTASTDALGALAYSFAGGATGEIEALGDSLGDSDIGFAEEVIAKLFTRDSKRWYQIKGPSMATPNYLWKAFGANLEANITAMRQTAETIGGVSVAGGSTARQTANRWLVGDDVAIPLPDIADPGDATINGLTASCVVHGDLHGGNVLCAGSKVSLIDYGNTGFGPRFIDAAALLCSIRLRSAEGITIDQALARFPAERALLDAIGDETLSIDHPPWARLCHRLERVALECHGSPVDATLQRELQRTELVYLLGFFQQVADIELRVVVIVRVGALLQQLGLRP